MTISRRLRIALTMVVLSVLIAPTAACGLFSRSKEKPPEASQPPAPPPPVATPAPSAPVATPAPPPPPPRPSGARIADEEKLKNLIQGKTTKAEVQQLFGIPQEIVLSPGTESYIYYRDKSSGWVSRTTERVETLTVRFDAKGVLKDFEYRYSGK
jgi:hypothetical protein